MCGPTSGQHLEAAGPCLPHARRSAQALPRVYVVSEVRLYREGLTGCLTQHGGLEMVGSGSCADALRQIAAMQPEVLLLDLVGRESLSIPRKAMLILPALRVVAVAVADLVTEVLACAEAGISGYVPNDGSVEDVVAAVLRAMNDELVCSPRIASLLFRQVATLSSGRTVAPIETALTPREREIAKLVACGLPNKIIARELQLGPATIKNHVHNILQKLNLQRRGEVARACDSTYQRRNENRSMERSIPSQFVTRGAER